MDTKFNYDGSPDDTFVPGQVILLDTSCDTRLLVVFKERISKKQIIDKLIADAEKPDCYFRFRGIFLVERWIEKQTFWDTDCDNYWNVGASNFFDRYLYGGRR